MVLKTFAPKMAQTKALTGLFAPSSLDSGARDVKKSRPGVGEAELLDQPARPRRGRPPRARGLTPTFRARETTSQKGAGVPRRARI